MNIENLNKANDLRSKIRNLELILNDFYVNNYDTFCTYKTHCSTLDSHYGREIKDLSLCDEIKQLIINKIAKYKKEFEEL